jgi:rubrerythrin
MEELRDVADRCDGKIPSSREYDQKVGESEKEILMKMQFDEATLNSMARIEALMKDELDTIQLRQRESLAVTEPGLRSVLANITETHKQIYAELETYLRELRSLNEITLQINEMFL